MAKGENQKLKLLYLMKILLEETDDEHGLTMEQIILQLDGYNISAERKSLYADMEDLRRYGLDIFAVKSGRTTYYHVGHRQFELAELKLLVDSVQASKFITAKKTNELIRKLEGLVSVHEASQLQRQVYVTDWVKTINESIYYSVDKLHDAIAMDVKVKFQYFQWNTRKEMELRKGGAYYVISPWALLWNDENYYMVGYDSEAGIPKHYRVDKMLKLELTQERRDGKERLEKFDVSNYSKKVFGMFDGEEDKVKLEFENRFAGVAIDRFGKDVTFWKTDEGHFQVHVDVVVSNQFLAWIMSLGSGVRIVGPEHVVQKMREEVRRLGEIYG